MAYKKLVWDDPKYISASQRFSELKKRQEEIRKLQRQVSEKKSDDVLTEAQEQEYQSNLTSLRQLKRSIQKARHIAQALTAVMTFLLIRFLSV